MIWIIYYFFASLKAWIKTTCLQIIGYLGLASYRILAFLFSIIIMKIRRKNSYDQSHFFHLKELYFFKLLLQPYDISLLKDYLRKSIQLVMLSRDVQVELDQFHYTYITSEEAEILINETHEKVMIKQGRQIQPHITSFLSHHQFLIYRVKRRTILVLQTLYFLQIPFLINMKSHQKLTFLQNCELMTLDYNSFVYRKGDAIDGVFWLMEGQVKMYKQINQKIYEVSSLESSRMFGLFQIKSSLNLNYRQLYAKSNMNNLRILKMPIRLIQQICVNESTDIVDYITSIKSELHSMVKEELNMKESMRRLQRQNCLRNLRHSENVMNKKEFQKRLKTFETDRNINNSILNKIVQSKKLILRVKELNGQIQNCMDVQNNQLLTSTYAIKHYNDKWKKDKDKKKKKAQPMLNSTRIQSTRSDAVNINGLRKYPAYRRYLLSRQQSCRAGLQKE